MFSKFRKKNFYVITAFPKAFESYLSSSILKRAREKGIIEIKFVNPRDFATDKHRSIDDKPYGGGPGMVMMADPIVKAASFAGLKIKNKKLKIILFSSRGKQFTQKMAADFAKSAQNFILISGRYEGIDERVKKILKTQEISIGPYILSGGELPALIFIDAVSRHLTGVLGKQESLEEIKGSYPVYTRPEIIEWKGKKYRAPKILLSGNHKKIKEWRKKMGPRCD